MDLPEVIVEVGAIRTGLVHGHAIVKISFKHPEGLGYAGEISVWIPEVDSLAAIKLAAVAKAVGALRSVSDSLETNVE